MNDLILFIDWISSHQTISWLITYVLIFFVFTLIGIIIDSRKTGMIIGVCIINAVSMVYAFGITHTQSFWITFIVLWITSSPVLYILFYSNKTENIKCNKDGEQ